jgi:hypothetical protein
VKIRRPYAATVVAIVASLGAAEAAEVVVLESTSPRYAAGQTVEAAQPVMLADGETLTIATEDGRLARIVGPYNGPPIGSEADESVARRALAQLLATDRPEVGGIGGVRGDAPSESLTDTRPDTWFVHAERSGDQCALQGKNVQLWRENAGAAAAMEIRVSLDDTAAQARWNAGAHDTAWPDSVALTDGTIYLLRGEGAVRSVPMRLHLLPPGLGTPGLAAVAWLAARGCTEQARLALR